MCRTVRPEAEPPLRQCPAELPCTRKQGAAGTWPEKNTLSAKQYSAGGRFFNPAAPLFSKKREHAGKKRFSDLHFPRDGVWYRFGKRSIKRRRNHADRTANASEQIPRAAIFRRWGVFLFPAPGSCPRAVRGPAVTTARVRRLRSACAAEFPQCRGTDRKPRRHARRRGNRSPGADARWPHVPDFCAAASVGCGAPQSGTRPRIRFPRPGAHCFDRAIFPFPAFSASFSPRESGTGPGLTGIPGRALIPANSFPAQPPPPHGKAFRRDPCGAWRFEHRTCFPLVKEGGCIMKRYLAEHWDTVLCIGLSILLAVGGVLAYFWMFPSQ